MKLFSLHQKKAPDELTQMGLIFSSVRELVSRKWQHCPEEKLGELQLAIERGFSNLVKWSCNFKPLVRIKILVYIKNWLGVVLLSGCLVVGYNCCRSSQFLSSSKMLKVILPFEQYLIYKWIIVFLHICLCLLVIRTTLK